MIKGMFQTLVSILVIVGLYSALAFAGAVYANNETVQLETVENECNDLEALQKRLDAEYIALKTYEIQAEEYCELN
jgi:hypothetical protein